jgi:hypothetical protein
MQQRRVVEIIGCISSRTTIAQTEPIEHRGHKAEKIRRFPLDEPPNEFLFGVAFLIASRSRGDRRCEVAIAGREQDHRYRNANAPHISEMFPGTSNCRQFVARFARWSHP